MKFKEKFFEGSPRPIFYKFSVPSGAIKDGSFIRIKPTKKQIAESLAQALIEGGFVHVRDGTGCPDRDLIEFVVCLYAIPKGRELP